MSAEARSSASGRRITLLTDFGTADGYVAAMKGVIAAIAPGILIDDATHAIPPGDVRSGAWALGAYWHLYPEGTVHVAVVDPGVGSDRRALAIEVDSRIIIAPDNGLISAVLLSAAPSAIVQISNQHVMRDTVSGTFHGRDVFAPAAAHAWSGMSLDEFGPAVADPVVLAATPIARSGDSVIGVVVHVDRFGNLITDIPAAGTGGGVLEVQGGIRIPVRPTYSDAASGDLVAVAGSRGTLEVAVRDGRAVDVLGVGRGSPVVFLRQNPSDAAPDI